MAKLTDSSKASVISDRQRAWDEDAARYSRNATDREQPFGRDVATKADSRELRTSSGIGAALFGGSIGSGGIGFHDDRPVATKAASAGATCHPRVKALSMPDGPRKTLLSKFAEKADTLPALEPISADRFEIAGILNVTPDEAALIVGNLVAAGLLVVQSDGATGVKLGYVLGRELR